MKITTSAEIPGKRIVKTHVELLEVIPLEQEMLEKIFGHHLRIL